MFSNVKTKVNSNFAVKVTERSNHSFLLSIRGTRFSDICTIRELQELNCLCKRMKNVRSSQPWISMNLVLNSAKHKFLFHVSIVKRKFFCLGKILPAQTSNLAICLDIYVGICRMPTQIASVTTESVCRLLYWNQSSNYYILVLLRRTEITTAFYFSAEKKSVCIRKIGKCN